MIARLSGRELVVHLVCLLAMISVVSWRRDAIFDGGVDSVVLAKAGLALLALGGAALLWLTAPRRQLIGMRSALLIGVALSVSLVGSLAAGGVTATGVVVVRVAILAVIVLALVSAAGSRVVLSGILVGSGVIAVVSGATGLPGYGAEGRLVGGIPEMGANELAGLAVAPLLALLVHILNRGARWTTVGSAAILAGIIVASGARTTLLALGAATLVALIVANRRHWTAVVGILATLPLGYTALAFTPAVADYALRGQTAEQIGSLSARTDAWGVVLGWDTESWERWIGVGLAVKTVAVNLRWRDTQVLDSSWISALAQTGVIGALLLALILLGAVVAAIRAKDRRALVLPLLVLLVVRSVTESGLLDSSSTFLLFFAIAVGLERRTLRGEPPSEPASDSAADPPSRDLVTAVRSR